MSSIPKAKLYLPVRRNAQVIDLTSNNGNELWQTSRLITQRIQAEDFIILWPEEDEDGHDALGGPEWPVKKVIWDSDGIMNLELALMILDPSADDRREYSERIQRGWSINGITSRRLWQSERDFDADMRRGGWTQYV